MKARFTRGSGTITLILKRDMGFKFGPTALNLKVFGSRIKPKALADSFLLTATFTKVNGLVTKRTEKVNIFMRKAPLTKGAGTKISKKVTEKKSGQMGRSTTVSTSAAKSTEKVCFNGPMAPSTTATGRTTKCMEVVCSNGPMVEFIRESI